MRVALLAAVATALSGHAAPAQSEHDFATIFGIKLGEPLAIPMCTEQDAKSPGAIVRSSDGTVVHAEVKRTCATSLPPNFDFETSVSVWFAEPLSIALMDNQLVLEMIDGRVEAASFDGFPESPTHLVDELKKMYGEPETSDDGLKWRSGGIEVSMDQHKGVSVTTARFTFALGEWIKKHPLPPPPKP